MDRVKGMDFQTPYRVAAVGLLFCFLGVSAPAWSDESDLDTAMDLAVHLRSAMKLLTNNQKLIDNSNVGFKNLTPDVVIDGAAKNFHETTGEKLPSMEGDDRLGRLLKIQLSAIRQVMDEVQSSINQKGIGFKGFVPAHFARYVNEKFNREAFGVASMKLTAPRRLVRNRRSLPDAYESAVLDKMDAPTWEHKAIHQEYVEADNKKTFRILVPLYYGEGCLACHGRPIGSLDITGHPKEGEELGALGGAVSVTLSVSQ
jgi:hypothetical protein